MCVIKKGTPNNKLIQVVQVPVQKHKNHERPRQRDFSKNY